MFVRCKARSCCTKYEEPRERCSKQAATLPRWKLNFTVLCWPCACRHRAVQECKALPRAAPAETLLPSGHVPGSLQGGFVFSPRGSEPASSCRTCLQLPHLPGQQQHEARAHWALPLLPPCSALGSVPSLPGALILGLPALFSGGFARRGQRCADG